MLSLRVKKIHFARAIAVDGDLMMPSQIAGVWYIMRERVPE
jgi:hypothetical protein